MKVKRKCPNCEQILWIDKKDFNKRFVLFKKEETIYIWKDSKFEESLDETHSRVIYYYDKMKIKSPLILKGTECICGARLPYLVPVEELVKRTLEKSKLISNYKENKVEWVNLHHTWDEGVYYSCPLYVFAKWEDTGEKYLRRVKLDRLYQTNNKKKQK